MVVSWPEWGVDASRSHDEGTSWLGSAQGQQGPDAGPSSGQDSKTSGQLQHPAHPSSSRGIPHLLWYDTSVPENYCQLLSPEMSAPTSAGYWKVKASEAEASKSQDNYMNAVHLLEMGIARGAAPVDELESALEDVKLRWKASERIRQREQARLGMRTPVDRERMIGRGPQTGTFQRHRGERLWLNHPYSPSLTDGTWQSNNMELRASHPKTPPGRSIQMKSNLTPGKSEGSVANVATSKGDAAHCRDGDGHGVGGTREERSRRDSETVSIGFEIPAVRYSDGNPSMMGSPSFGSGVCVNKEAQCEKGGDNVVSGNGSEGSLLFDIPSGKYPVETPGMRNLAEMETASNIAELERKGIDLGDTKDVLAFVLARLTEAMFLQDELIQRGACPKRKPSIDLAKIKATSNVEEANSQSFAGRLTPKGTPPAKEEGAFSSPMSVDGCKEDVVDSKIYSTKNMFASGRPARLAQSFDDLSLSKGGPSGNSGIFDHMPTDCWGGEIRSPVSCPAKEERSMSLSKKNSEKLTSPILKKGPYPGCGLVFDPPEPNKKGAVVSDTASRGRTQFQTPVHTQRPPQERRFSGPPGLGLDGVCEQASHLNLGLDRQKPRTVGAPRSGWHSPNNCQGLPQNELNSGWDVGGSLGMNSANPQRQRSVQELFRGAHGEEFRLSHSIQDRCSWESRSRSKGYQSHHGQPQGSNLGYCSPQQDVRQRRPRISSCPVASGGCGNRRSSLPQHHHQNHFAGSYEPQNDSGWVQHQRGVVRWFDNDSSQPPSCTRSQGWENPGHGAVQHANGWGMGTGGWGQSVGGWGQSSQMHGGSWGRQQTRFGQGERRGRIASYPNSISIARDHQSRGSFQRSFVGMEQGTLWASDDQWQEWE